MNNAMKYGLIIGAIIIFAVVVIIVSNNDTSENDNVAMTDESVEAESADNEMMVQEDETMMVNESDEQTPQAMTGEDESEEVIGEGNSDEMMAEEDSAGVYTAYSETLLENAADGDVVLFFKASWCSTCTALDKDIKEQLDEIPTNVTIFEVDYDDATELRKKYGVTVQHTLVQVDESGEMISKWVGSPDLDALLTKIQ